jgi:RIO kinase 1
MTFIGEDGVPAPLLREVKPEDPTDFYTKIINEVKLMYTKARIVHGDLSEYNIMVWEGIPVIFDVSQAMLTSHPLSQSLITRDITNINSYFGRLGVDTHDAEELEQWVKGESEKIS